MKRVIKDDNSALLIMDIGPSNGVNNYTAHYSQQLICCPFQVFREEILMYLQNMEWYVRQIMHISLNALGFDTSIHVFCIAFDQEPGSVLPMQTTAVCHNVL